MNGKSFKDIYDEARERSAYWSADIIYSFTEDLARSMEEQSISRSELARRLGTSPAYVTKIMRGDVNFTVNTMIRLADAVGARIEVRLTTQGDTYSRKTAEQGKLPEVATAKE